MVAGVVSHCGWCASSAGGMTRAHNRQPSRRTPIVEGARGGTRPKVGGGGKPNQNSPSSEGRFGLKKLLRFSRAVDAFNTFIGQWVAWAILAAILVSAANATVRKIFNTSSNAWLEIQWILFGMVFLLCSAWALLSNEHIRIDIVNNMLPKRLRDSIDVFG